MTLLADWLLEDSPPSLKYRVLTELIDKPTSDSEVKETKSQIANSSEVQQLFKKMHPDGYWLQKKSSTKELIGDGMEYGSFATTHFILAYLAELGMDKSNLQIAKAAERYLGQQKEDGDWWLYMSCLTGYNIRTFVLLGYKDDPRVQKSLQLLLNTNRDDGGYLCKMHDGKYKTREVKSCIRGACKALLAFAEFPEIYDHQRCKQLVEYFLHRHGFFKTKDPSKVAAKDMLKLSFPITWGANSWEILYALSKMGYGNDERLIPAWKHLESLAITDGIYPLHYTGAQIPIKFGKKGEANKWISFYVAMAKKFCGV